MFCTKCGKEIAEDAVVCIHCGRSVNDIPLVRPKLKPAGANVRTGLFANAFAFRGVIGRLEFILSYIILVLLSVHADSVSCLWNEFGVPFFDLMFHLGSGGEWLYIRLVSIWRTLLWLFVVWFGLAQTIKRCHDTGHSGWFSFIPIFNPLFLIFFSAKKRENKYA
ncbi:protein DUF805 [Candidatus Termititenax dinenymphae]|uniref:Protein DUF805 n=1 Tax=Candidatus Termititenax dinenymphae TaxID=2218523 RepID=A0A388TJW0_9BACT|nr:protein DUF805 [Candidatus Termititenax dinenymphae]